MKFSLGICLKFQILGAHANENLIQCLGEAHETAFLTRTLNGSDAGGTQIKTETIK